MDKFFLKWTVLPLLILFFTACGVREKKSLFNGKDLDHWIIKAKPDDRDKGFWKVDNGVIEANTLGMPEHDYVWLYSREEYRDFEIDFEFQAFKDSPGNSGIQIRSRYDDESYWLNGPQIDIHPPAYWRTGMMWDETRGNQRWIFPEIPEGTWVDSTMALNDHVMFYASDDPSWNKMKVRVNDMRIQAWLNGTLITDYNGDGVLNDQLHQNKKVGTTGHIAFQIHTGDELKIRYRNIYIEEL